MYVIVALYNDFLEHTLTASMYSAALAFSSLLDSVPFHYTQQCEDVLMNLPPHYANNVWVDIQ